jgi:hypothetical protein
MWLAPPHWPFESRHAKPRFPQRDQSLIAAPHVLLKRFYVTMATQVIPISEVTTIQPILFPYPKMKFLFNVVPAKL